MVHGSTRSGPTTPIESSRQLQRKLYSAAKGSRNRRFHALYDRIFRPDVLTRAWQEVRANKGSAGVDGVSIEDVERQGVGWFLRSLWLDLKAGEYRPKPVLRVYIPKPDGRQRPLGIPTVRDRVVQQACKIVMEPIFEASFEDCSHGFRPKRSALQAVEEIKQNLVRGWWVVDADIQGYFDAIDHDILMSLVGKRVGDRRVLKLIRGWLKAGVVEEGRWQASESGSPQGGVISPLLANIYLHVLDRIWTTRHGTLGRLVRYADDFVIICRSKWQAERALRVVRGILDRLRLVLSPTKTRVVDAGREGFEFLGFHFHKCRSRRTNKLVPYLWPGQKAMKSVRERIRQLTSRSYLCEGLSKIVARLIPVIRGWRNYFQMGNSTRQLQQLDWYVRLRLRIVHDALNRGNVGKLQARFERWIAQSGIVLFYSTGICVPSPRMP